jgi:hypothetical protein
VTSNHVGGFRRDFLAKRVDVPRSSVARRTLESMWITRVDTRASGSCGSRSPASGLQPPAYPWGPRRKNFRPSHPRLTPVNRVVYSARYVSASKRLVPGRNCTWPLRKCQRITDRLATLTHAIFDPSSIARSSTYRAIRLRSRSIIAAESDAIHGAKQLTYSLTLPKRAGRTALGCRQGSVSKGPLPVALDG